MGLTPILISAYGRNGTTALMSLLGTDPRIRFDRIYPFENRHLTYLAKFSILNVRRDVAATVTPEVLCEYSELRFGNVPWVGQSHSATEPMLGLRTAELLPVLWQAFSDSTTRLYPGATHYAEKAPVWLPNVARQYMPCKVLHLVRDPRDVYLSANAFMKALDVKTGFGRCEHDTAVDHAFNFAGGLSCFFEAARADCGRADSLVVRYEDLIFDRAGTTKKINEFFDLELDADPDKAIRNYMKKHQTSASVDQSVGRWKREPMPPGVLDALEVTLREAMDECGYEVSRRSRSLLPSYDFPEMLRRGEELRFSAHGTMALGPAGTADATVTGEDFYIELPPARFAAEMVQEVWLCFRGRAGKICSLFWHGPREGFSDERVIHGEYCAGEHWQVMRFPVSTHPRWRGSIDRLRVDAFNGQFESSFSGSLRYLRLAPAPARAVAAAAA